MTERPIIFSGPMVQAIIDDRKTQTRRAIKHQPIDIITKRPKTIDGKVCYCAKYTDEPPTGKMIYCRHGEVGDRLWVRESWCEYGKDNAIYRANYGYHTPISDGIGGPWKSPMFMPRKFSRIILEITDTWPERIQSISGSDIMSEGLVLRGHRVEGLGQCPVSAFDKCVYPDLKSLVANAWDSINKKKAPWDSNPWVWVIEFRRVDG